MASIRNTGFVSFLYDVLVVIFKNIYTCYSSRIVLRLRWFFRDLRWRAMLAGFGEGSHIFPCVVIHSPDNVMVGSKVSIAEFVHMWGLGGITIGDNVLIASHAVITSQTHDVNVKVYCESELVKPVVLEDNVWIGAGAVILPGITVGEGSIIGAGSVVTRDVLPGSVMVGVPARKLRSVMIDESR